MIYKIIKLLLGSLVKVFWLEKIEGKHYIPKKGPIIIAANHASYLDFAFLVAATKRRLYFLAAEFIYKNPFFRVLMKATGQIKVDRFTKGKKFVYQAAEDVLKRGHILTIFPEGTRSLDGAPLKAYKGVARIALQNKVDILPVSIFNAHHVFGKADKFPKFRRICKVVFLSPVRYEDIKEMTPEEIVHDILMPKIYKDLGHNYLHK